MIKARVEERVLDNEEWLTLEETLEGILQECHETLQTLGVIGDDDNYGYAGMSHQYASASPLLHTDLFSHLLARNVAKYTTWMNEDEIKTQPDIAKLLQKLQTHLAHRKTRRRDIRTALTTEVMDVLKAGARDGQPIYDAAAAVVNVTGDEDEYGDDDNEIDDAALEGEPESWKAAEENQIFVVDDRVGDHDDDNDEDNRVRFIQTWLEKVYPNISIYKVVTDIF